MPASSVPRRPSTSPPVEEEGDEAPQRGYDSDGDESSVPSTLYARCTASTSHALNARRMRQAVEADVRFLQNRLSKLKQEEQRARSEVEGIRKKTAEVEMSKAKHDETVSSRRQMRDLVDYSKRREAALIALNKERQSKAVWAAKQRVIQDRRDAVLALRKQKEINECRVQILREEDREHHAKQRLSIRQLHEMSRQRREREVEAKREAARLQFQQRVEQEQSEREAKEQLAAQLIAQEAQLIHRLRRMHHEKQQALAALAHAVSHGSRSNSPDTGAGTTALNASEVRPLSSSLDHSRRSSENTP